MRVIPFRSVTRSPRNFPKVQQTVRFSSQLLSLLQSPSLFTAIPFSTTFHPPLKAAAMTSFRIVDNEEQDNRYDLFDVYFHSDTIKTTVTSDPEIVTQWISETESSLHDRRIVGLDVEWRSSFHRNQQFKVATLQLCDDSRCLIFQLLCCSSIPDSLVSFLSNGDYTFVGVGVENDEEKLVEDYELSVRNMVDLRALAANAYEMSNLKTAELKELCNVVLGKDMEKPRHIKWLSLDQIKYACIDAFLSFEIAKHLNFAAAP